MAGDESTQDHSIEAAPIGNNNRLNATNSQIGNAAQIIGSPGTVITQVHLDQNSLVVGILSGMFGVLLLVLLAVLPSLGKGVPVGVTVFVVGLSMALIVSGFFGWVDSLLKSVTRMEIAEWLIGVEVGEKVEPWHRTFATVFDRVFGWKHLSWKCFLRCSLASVAAYYLCWTLLRRSYMTLEDSVVFAGLGLLPDYISLLKTRRLLKFSAEHKTISSLLLALGADVILGVALLIIVGNFAMLYSHLHPEPVFRPIELEGPIDFQKTPELLQNDLKHVYRVLPNVAAVYFASIWLWLYAASGFLLKTARRFDIGFYWFSQKFDIEKKPLSAIGLVAGAMVALVYWMVVIAGRFIGT